MFAFLGTYHQAASSQSDQQHSADIEMRSLSSELPLVMLGRCDSSKQPKIAPTGLVLPLVRKARVVLANWWLEAFNKWFVAVSGVLTKNSFKYVVPTITLSLELI